MATPILSFQNFSIFSIFDPITDAVTDKMHAVHDSARACWNSDCKIHTLLVIGRVLEVAAVTASIGCVTAAFVAGPAVLVGVVPAVAMYVLGHFMVYNNNSFWYAFISLPFVDSLLPKPFIPGQPVGLVNSQYNCFINTFLQCIVHIPALRQRAQRVPQLAQFIQYYRNLQGQAENREVINARGLNAFLTRIIQGRGRNGEHELRRGQGDVNTLFEWLLEADLQSHTDSFYQFQTVRTLRTGKQLNPTQTQEDLIRLQLNALPQLEPFSVLFNHYLDNRTDRGERRQFKFIALPETLAICLERGKMENGHRYIIRDPVLGIDTGLDLLPDMVLGGHGTHYDCEAFIIQSGSFVGGHYVACIKKDERWYYCNDRQVYEICEEKAHELMKDCYFVFLNRAQ